MAASTFDDPLTWQKVGTKTSGKSADAEPPTQPPHKMSRMWQLQDLEEWLPICAQ
jgi:hypothetical protein